LRHYIKLRIFAPDKTSGEALNPPQMKGGFSLQKDTSFIIKLIKIRVAAPHWEAEMPPKDFPL